MSKTRDYIASHLISCHGSLLTPTKEQLREMQQAILEDLAPYAPKPSFDTCDGCGKQTLRAKELWEGGGVECTDPKCGYWFCY